MQIESTTVKELRERTGAGMLDCKKALSECDGDLEKAFEYLRKKNLAATAKRAGRRAAEGLVFAYIHPGSRVGVLVEVNCETDFVARTGEFAAFVKDVAMQVAAASPGYVTRAEVPEAEIAKERDIRREQARATGKPDAVLDRIVQGQIEKWLGEICLLDQKWIRDDGKTIATLVKELIARTGENVVVRRFARFELGESSAGDGSGG